MNPTSENHRGDFVTGVLPAAVGHLEEFGGALLGGLAAAVVAGGGLDLGMARELLHGAEIGTRAYPVESVDINFDATVEEPGSSNNSEVTENGSHTR
jgi:hypothetical protein